MLGRWIGFTMALLILSGWVGSSEGVSQAGISAPRAVDQLVAAEQEASVADGQTVNPHSDLIFRVTGATSCRDCHRAERDKSLSPRTLDNDLVRNLRSKAKGIHGPGRFADCLRCHAGGRKGVEKY